MNPQFRPFFIGILRSQRPPHWQIYQYLTFSFTDFNVPVCALKRDKSNSFGNVELFTEMASIFVVTIII